jgi:hypothetical protein
MAALQNQLTPLELERYSTPLCDISLSTVTENGMEAKEKKQKSKGDSELGGCGHGYRSVASPLCCPDDVVHLQMCQQGW